MLVCRSQTCDWCVIVDPDAVDLTVDSRGPAPAPVDPLPPSTPARRRDQPDRQPLAGPRAEDNAEQQRAGVSTQTCTPAGTQPAAAISAAVLDKVRASPWPFLKGAEALGVKWSNGLAGNKQVRAAASIWKGHHLPWCGLQLQCPSIDGGEIEQAVLAVLTDAPAWFVVVTVAER